MPQSLIESGTQLAWGAGALARPAALSTAPDRVLKGARRASGRSIGRSGPDVIYNWREKLKGRRRLEAGRMAGGMS